MTSPALDASVILATYNQLESTSLALQALFAQETGHSYEVIVCDDGSDTATVAALAALLREAPVPSYLVWQQDQGFRLAASRNNGIHMSRGRILIFLDGDLVPEADFVERHVQAHRHDKLIAIGKRFWRLPDVVRAGLGQGRLLWDILRGWDARDQGTELRGAYEAGSRRYFAKMQPWMDCFGCNISVTKAPGIAFDEGFTDWGHEDWDLFYGLHLCGYEIAYVEAVAYDVAGEPKPWGLSQNIAHLRTGLRFYDKWAHTGLRPEFAVPYNPLVPGAAIPGGGSLPSHGWARAYENGYVKKVRKWLEEVRDPEAAG